MPKMARLHRTRGSCPKPSSSVFMALHINFSSFWAATCCRRLPNQLCFASFLAALAAHGHRAPLLAQSGGVGARTHQLQGNFDNPHSEPSVGQHADIQPGSAQDGSPAQLALKMHVPWSNDSKTLCSAQFFTWRFGGEFLIKIGLSKCPEIGRQCP